MIYKNIFIAALVIFNILIPAYSTTDDEKTRLSGHQVKIKDKSVVLIGNKVVTGQPAPNFKVVDEQFKAVRLNDFSGKVVLISVVPSIDTGICSLQTKRFNDEVLNLPGNVKLLTISTDLPFAQKRFCIEENVSQIQLLSDSVWRDFGRNYGLLIKDMGLLSRAVLIVDAEGTLAYQQVVPQISQEPDYDDALKALKELLPEVAAVETTAKAL